MEQTTERRSEVQRLLKMQTQMQGRAPSWLTGKLKDPRPMMSPVALAECRATFELCVLQTRFSVFQSQDNCREYKSRWRNALLSIAQLRMIDRRLVMNVESKICFV